MDEWSICLKLLLFEKIKHKVLMVFAQSKRFCVTNHPLRN
ncbi:hypothetical protein Y045_5583 [Burkholderia pseudomallei MSHR2451]|nr:hypothetical protein Y045_5583 [Burkholderia pseudomallei MSHR2451]